MTGFSDPKALAAAVDPLGFTQTKLDQGWNPGFIKPPKSGLYQRRHSFGGCVDFYDGRLWKRTNSVQTVCANQSLEWREPVHG